MKKQIKLITIGIAAVCLIASCKKNNENGNSETPTNGTRFTANIEQNDSRTYLDDLNVKWSEADRIKVSNNTGQTEVFQLTSGKETTSGVFHTVTGAIMTDDVPYVAVYPAINPNQVDNTIDGTTVTVDLPAVQTIAEAGTFGVGYNPMVAFSNDNTLQFKNLCGGIGLPFKGTDDLHHVSKVVLTSNDRTETLWGTGTVECGANEPEMVVTNTDNLKHQLTLNCDIILSSTESQMFYFMLPPHTLKTGFSFAVYDGNNIIYQNAVEWSSNPDFIKRNWLMTVESDIIVGNRPTVVTHAATDILKRSATLHGEVTHTGGTEITERGLCWSLTENPTTDNSHQADQTGSGIGAYDFRVNRSLQPGTTYHVRAYAINADGIFYGEDKTFKTPDSYFSVSEDDVVFLAPGNLQYKGGSFNTWRFAEEQWYFVGTGPDAVHTADLAGNVYQDGVKCDNERIAQSYTGWIDLFGWGTSGYNGCNIWKDDTNDAQYGPASGDIAGTLYDWGLNNNIFNPKTNSTEAAGTWRTPTASEMNYMLKLRSASTVNGTANARFVKAKIDTEVLVKPDDPAYGTELCGLIILPDYYEHPEGVTALVAINTANDPYSNVIPKAQWEQMEEEGAIFLPISDYRDWSVGQGGSYVGELCSYGVYWTSSVQSTTQAKAIRIATDNVNTPFNDDCHKGFCVRLVKDTTK